MSLFNHFVVVFGLVFALFQSSGLEMNSWLSACATVFRLCYCILEDVHGARISGTGCDIRLYRSLIISVSCTLVN